MKLAMVKLLELRRNWKEKDLDEEKIKSLLEYNSKFLKMSEDCPTIFNFRKDILQSLFKIILDDMKKLVDEN